MFFFFKKPTVTIDAFVPDQYAFAQEYAPVEKASNFLPNWYKELQPFNKNFFLSIDPGLEIRNSKMFFRTARGCPGINNVLLDGIIIPLWSDLRMDWSAESYSYQFSDQMSSVKLHGTDQVEGFADNYWIIKVESPWIFSFSKPTRIVHLPLTFYLGMNHPFKTVYGIQETKTSNNLLATNQFFFLEKVNRKQNLIYNFKTPFSHYLLPKENNYKINCIVDSTKINKFSSLLDHSICFFNKTAKMKILDKKNREK